MSENHMSKETEFVLFSLSIGKFSVFKQIMHAGRDGQMKLKR